MRHKSPHRLRPTGFTLLELMTAIAVLGVLAAVGVPAFGNIVRNNQIAAESSDLMSALQLARSEALKRGIRVSVCAAAADGATCSDDTNWSRGWLMFTDDFGDLGVLDDSDVLLQVWSAPANGVTVQRVTEEEDTPITFTRMARAEFEQTFEVSKAGCGADQLRQIEVDISGRIGLSRADCAEE